LIKLTSTKRYSVGVGVNMGVSVGTGVEVGVAVGTTSFLVKTTFSSGAIKDVTHPVHLYVVVPGGRDPLENEIEPEPEYKG
jgi:hypothetical protein